MNIPQDLYYTNDHEWVRVDGSEGAVGITDYAQGELGDIVFLDLPEVGANVKQNSVLGTIEAVKAAVDLYAPVSGEIVAVNGLLDQQPELINQMPYEDGWIVKIMIKDMEELDTLMKADAYRELVEKTKGE